HHPPAALPLEEAVGEGAEVVHALGLDGGRGQGHPGRPLPGLHRAALQLRVAELLLQPLDPFLSLVQPPLQLGTSRRGRPLAARPCWLTSRPTRRSSSGATARLKEKSKVVWSGPT